MPERPVMKSGLIKSLSYKVHRFRVGDPHPRLCAEVRYGIAWMTGRITYCNIIGYLRGRIRHARNDRHF